MIIDGLHPFQLKSFFLKTLSFKSQSLLNNPLNDPADRFVPVLVPKDLNSKTPIIFYLSGFASDGWKNMSFNRFEQNTAQQIDQWTTDRTLPQAVYVFVSAWTKWGGSQFINSVGCGSYQDYIIKDLVVEFKRHFPDSSVNKNWIIMGGSSGGYGALYLSSKFPEVFKHVIAIAPDSLFDVSLLPELYKYLPYLDEFGGLKNFIKALDEGDVKYPDHILFGLRNIIAMTLCYAPVDSDMNFKMPIDKSGKVIVDVWSEWLKYDPIRFLSLRKKSLAQLNSIRLYAGNKDEYGLQYGARQIHKLLNSLGINSEYFEKSGTHRDINKFRLQALSGVLKNI